jgi:DNA-binding NtrC family response regulator
LASILVIEDEPILARNISDALALPGHQTQIASSGEEGLALVLATEPDVILLDLRLPGIDGLETLRRLRQLTTSAAIIFMTAHGGVRTAVDAIKAGANDYLSKPIELAEVRLIVDRARKSQSTQAEISYFRERDFSDVSVKELVGESVAMQRLRAVIERLAASPALQNAQPPSILITGETGTGKDLVARAIHAAGPRRDAQFVHVNCTAIPDTLFESELFGHTKGAFTGAQADKRGLFDVGDGGTVFLDEIGHTPIALQAKLLSVLERRIIRPVGATRERPVNVHVIAATHRNLAKAIADGEFREDLFHRLQVLSIDVPPLRDRREDIPLLAGRFLRRYAAQFRSPVRGFSQPATALLVRHDWPGNVRELMHTVESAVLISDGPVITPDHLNVKMIRRGENGQDEFKPVARRIELEFTEAGPRLEDIEYEVITAALEQTGNNLTHAAKILGISRDAIRYRLERYRDRG